MAEDSTAPGHKFMVNGAPVKNMAMKFERNYAGNVHGTFSGVLSPDAADVVFSSKLTAGVEILLYAPATLPWYRAWWVRLRRQEWPQEVVFAGTGHVGDVSSRFDGPIEASFVVDTPFTVYVRRNRTWAYKARVLWRLLVRKAKGRP